MYPATKAARGMPSASLSARSGGSGRKRVRSTPLVTTAILSPSMPRPMRLRLNDSVTATTALALR